MAWPPWLASGFASWRAAAAGIILTPASNLNRNIERNVMSVGTILLVILILMLIGAFPAWPHSRNWGYYPSGGLGLVVLILLILVLTGRL
jgi:hypothetical protein